MQVGKAASKGGSVADKAGSAAKDIKGKNPFGEWDMCEAGNWQSSCCPSAYVCQPCLWSASGLPRLSTGSGLRCLCLQVTCLVDCLAATCQRMTSLTAPSLARHSRTCQAALPAARCPARFVGMPGCWLLLAAAADCLHPPPCRGVAALQSMSLLWF